MSHDIDLVWIGAGEEPGWPLGRVIRADPTPASLAFRVAIELPQSSATAWLFWGDQSSPDPRRVEEALGRPGDLWHAGLRLGMAGLPPAIDFVAPTWMLNCDPDPAIEATSWRLSLEACLVRTDVLRCLGGVRPEFETLLGAALELGHRYVTRGVLMRHVPWLVPDVGRRAALVLSLEEELRFVYYRFGRRWLLWSLARSVLTGRTSLWRAWEIFGRIANEPRPETPPPFRELVAGAAPRRSKAMETVTVLIPTVERYPYLRMLLDQLRRQTVAPLEIVIVDQTSRERRDTGLSAEFSDLPLRVFYLDRAGQCSSRNIGIEASKGDFILFLDDDDEVPPDLIERHLASLERFRGEVSSGVAEEDGAGPMPEAFRLIRVSDVFPAGNSLVVKSVLAGSGLFDLAYDRGSRADGDLGMRLYLSGALMVLNPEISVLHHHAPSGGLRTHRARVITYASSRTGLLHRHLPSATEVYLSRRYFFPRQVREMLWLVCLGTFSIRGGAVRRLSKVIVSLFNLPDTLWQIRKSSAEAAAMLGDFPKIPSGASRKSVSGQALPSQEVIGSRQGA